MDQPLWQPSAERIERANMTALARQVAAAHGERLRDYVALRAWSVERPELFWPALWQYAGVQASRRWQDVLVDGERYEGPFYVKHPFTQEPDWAVTSINLDLDQLLARAEQPA